MSLIDMEFKNLPDKTTPVNATNLNKIINGINFLDDKRMTAVTESNTDLNDYTETGTYFFNGSVTPKNIPVGSNGWLQVIESYSGGPVKQIWYRFGTINTNDFNTYVRTGNGTEWSNWERLIVENNLFYKPGDTEDIHIQFCSGHITGSTKSFRCSLILPKRIDNISSISITGGNFTLRGTSGYVDSLSGGIDYNTSGYTVTIDNSDISKGNVVSLLINKSSGFTNVANNTPVNAYIYNIKLKFN